MPWLPGANVFLPMPNYATALPAAQTGWPAPKIVVALVAAVGIFILYGFLGFIGLKLARKNNWPDLLDERVSNRARFLIPGLIGAGLGVIVIFSDLIFRNFNGIGSFPHPAFPASILTSYAAGFGEELLFRLFFISFWYWLISKILKARRGNKFPHQGLVQADMSGAGWRGDKLFWALAILSALFFAAGHYPSFTLIFGLNIAQMPLALHLEIMVLNSLAGFVCAYYFRKSGFLAAAGIHFWTDIIWHVLWGGLF